MGSDLFKLDLLGQSLTIRSNEDPANTAKVVDYLNLKLNEVQRETRLSDPVKISLLAALNVVEELLALRSREDREPPDSVEIEAITERLISRIDLSLQEAQAAPPGQEPRPGLKREGPAI